MHCLNRALAWEAGRSHEVHSTRRTISVHLVLWSLRGDRIIVVIVSKLEYVMGRW